MNNHLLTFLAALSESIEKDTFIKLTLACKRNHGAELKNIFVKPVTIKNNYQLSFTYRYPTQDITKNFSADESMKLIQKMLEEEFYNGDAFTSLEDYLLVQQPDGKSRLKKIKKEASGTTPLKSHDKTKNRLLQTSNKYYLQALGITGKDGIVKKDMQAKFRQINRYVEIIEGIIKDFHFHEKFHITDMGSGKGYLTFALYDYLTNVKKVNVQMEGVEMRNELVEKCNQIATKSAFDQLIFSEGSIAESKINHSDMLIALHACDTATDDAIFKGIEQNMQIIICAPCCHKQVRKSMQPINAIQSITQHGILLERQAEMLTDTIRALLLESKGYKTKVFDFIETEHTPKNVIITAIKTKLDENKQQQALDKVGELKELFGLKQHYLEQLISDK